MGLFQNLILTIVCDRKMEIQILINSIDNGSSQNQYLILPNNYCGVERLKIWI